MMDKSTVVRLCAEAIGLKLLVNENTQVAFYYDKGEDNYLRYEPHTNKEQAFELVERLGLQIRYFWKAKTWRVANRHGRNAVHLSDLATAICECAALVQQAKESK